MLADARVQEAIALAIVAAVAWILLRRFFWNWIAPGVAEWLLKRGQVKLAMRLRWRK